MAKGQTAKTEIVKKLLETFEDSWVNEKEVRIPWIEDGAEVQIKVTLTCAKENIPHPGEGGSSMQNESGTVAPTDAVPELTNTEKKNVADMLSMLGL